MIPGRSPRQKAGTAMQLAREVKTSVRRMITLQMQDLSGQSALDRRHDGEECEDPPVDEAGGDDELY